MSFVHLHLHTEYSLLDGECRINRLPAAVKTRGQNAVAITDHGVLYGVVDFYKKCRAAGVKPIIGCEVYVAPESRFDKVYGKDSEYSHLVLLCKNEQGYKNLMVLVSAGFTEGFYSKPRIDTELLSKHCEGLIALSGCIKGKIPQLIINDDIAAAREYALKLKGMFGEDFYFELQRHGLDSQTKVNNGLMLLSRQLDIPPVATNDVHYIDRADSKTQELLLLIQTGRVMGDSAIEFYGDNFYLKTEEEMRMLFSDCPEAVDNTQIIADRCGFDFDFNTPHLPVFTPPLPYTAKDYLRKQCLDGYREKCAKKIVVESKEYTERLEYELSVVEQMGFVDYYLIVNDFVSFARSHGIPTGPGRGSGVGSLAAFFLGITGVDPIKNSLLFERFLNPERVSMPDFDIDFSDTRRGEVIDYVISKYGSDKVSQIINFNTLACRAAVRDAGRALGMSYSRIDEIAKLIPRALGITLETAMSENPILMQKYNSDNDVKQLLDYVRALEGRPRNTSSHASGVVITDKPITEYVPLATTATGTVTQFTMNTVAELGLLKIDFLGLRFLSIIAKAESEVRKILPDFSTDALDYNDREVYSMLSRGDSIGLFQLESAGMQRLLIKMSPNCLEDITLAISLYRPGPMMSIPAFLKNRHSPENITYRSELLAPILAPTCGCIIYQEQVMQIFKALAGYTHGRADIVRRAMAKKKTAEMEREREVFINGANANGISKSIAEEIFNEMSEFAKYAFNKSHAAAYAVLAYKTAYLKCHYPRQYLSALLDSVMGDRTKIRLYAEECRRMGFGLLCPNINESDELFSVSADGNILFALTAVKNVSSAYAAAIVAERTENGSYKDMADFLSRTYRLGNTRMTEALISAGAFDSFGIYRSKLIACLDKAIYDLNAVGSRNVPGQIGLFESVGMDNGSETLELSFPTLNDYSQSDKLSAERELTGLYFSGHPLNDYSEELRKYATFDTRSLSEGLSDGSIKEKQRVTVGGLVLETHIKTTKNGEQMAFSTVEDAYGELEIVIFPKTFEKFGALFTEGSVVIACGDVQLKDSFGNEGVEEITLLLNSASAPKKNVGDSSKKLYLKITAQNSGKLDEALSEIKPFKGGTPLLIYYEDTKKLLQSKDIFCQASDTLILRLKSLLGEECVKLV